MIDNARRYQELGWNIFPIKENEKAPAIPNGFRGATNDIKIIEGWWSKTAYNIGLRLDGLCVIDIDTHGSVNGYASLTEFDMPSTVTASTPSGGRHYYFKDKHGVSRKTGFRPGIDRLTNGYVILPESTHPNGGKYEWMKDRSPWDLEIADLPDAFRENKTPTPWSAPLPKPTPTQKKDIKDRAILYVQNCEPAVMGMSGHNQLIYAASALVNGFDLSDQEAINILWNHYNPMCSPPWDQANPSDRKDFERKVIEARKTCMKPRGWLIGEERPEVSPDPLGERIQKALLQNLENKTTKKAEKFEVPIQLDADKPKVIFEKMPPLIKETADWIDSKSIVLQPWITLGSLLPMFGAILGKKYSFLGNRSNINVITAAPSSSGKENARKRIRELLEAAQLDDVLGGEDPTSDTAILRVVKEKERVLYLWDEIGHLFANTKSDKSATHLKAIVPTLMKLYSAAGGTYGGKDYAQQKDSIVKIKDPHCCFYGTTTPGMLYKAFDGEDADSGFMGRILFFLTDEEPEPTLGFNTNPPPQALVDKIAEVGRYIPINPEAEGLLKNSDKDEILNSLVKEIPISNDAYSLLEQYLKKMHNFKVKEAEGPLKALVGKSFEQMCRLCIIACVCSHKKEIDYDCVDWSCSLVEYLVNQIVDISRQRLDSNDFKDKARKVFAYIQKKDGGNGVPHSIILRNLSFLNNTNELANIRKHLEDSELIVTTHKGRGISYFVNTMITQ